MNSFYDHLSYMTSVFDTWTPCERTVVLCALFRRVPWFNFKLLKHTMDSMLDMHSSPEAEAIEKDANDIAIITETAKTTDENDQVVDMGEKFVKLLVYLPLLEHDNQPVKEAYLNSVPDIIQVCVDSNTYMHECKQYLSYMLIHPALDANDRGSLGHWLRYLENHLAAIGAHDPMQRRGSSSSSNYGSVASISTGYGSNSNLNEGTNGSTWNLSVIGNLVALPENGNSGAFRRTIGKNLESKSDTGSSTECLCDSFTKNGKELDLSAEEDIVEPLAAKSTRSNSLTSPMSSHTSSSTENLNVDEYFVQKPRSFSLSSEHMAQMKPLLNTTGSETRLDVLKANNYEHPGMTTVAQWLKSLRLHKYVWLFSNISYEQMMAMDEEYLHKLGVTTGARHKLLLCINKLHLRPALLETMAQQLRNETLPPPAVGLMLEQLREVLVSPIPPASQLSDQLVQVLELASTKLLSGTQSNPPLPAFPPYNHQADDQNYEHPIAGYDPLSMHCWLLDRALHHPSFTCSAHHVDTLKRLRYRLPPRQFFSHISDVPFTKRNAKTRWRSQGPSKPQFSTSRRSSGSFLGIPNMGNFSLSRPTNGKSSSYPSFPAKSADSSPRFTHHSHISLNDINSRLESLCVQMTEQAMTD